MTSKAVDIGPVHPWLLEPVKIELIEEGGKVVDVSITAGYVHRGIEKLLGTNPYRRGLFIAERVCGICSTVHSCVFSHTVEKVMGIEVPARARYIRTIALEVERLHSHFLWHGLLCHACGEKDAFQRTLAAREVVMDLTEAVSGNRVNQNMNSIGGVRRDIGAVERKVIVEALPRLKALAESCSKDLNKGKGIAKKVTGTGILDRRDALRFGAVGPVLRGSGVKSDARHDDMYAAYQELAFKPVIEEGCDTLARARVRAGENLESIRLIEEGLKDMPDGPLSVEPSDPLEGEFLGRHEAPRGELVYFIRSNGTNVPARVKLRAPTYANLPPLKRMLIGEDMSKVRYVIESIDLCLSCTDR